MGVRSLAQTLIHYIGPAGHSRGEAASPEPPFCRMKRHARLPAVSQHTHHHATRHMSKREREKENALSRPIERGHVSPASVYVGGKNKSE